MKKTGIIFVLFTSNNILCSLTSLDGSVLMWTSAGAQRLRSVKKSVPTTIYSLVIKTAFKAVSIGFSHVHLKLKGLHKNKKSITKALSHSNIKLLSLQDITAQPHNGCRSTKKRRL